jgi:hypothetical protein
MRVEVARDLSDSAYDFLRVVWPEVESWCGGGELRPVEAVASAEFERSLDMLAGIDAWQIIGGEGIRGIASRVQWIKPKKPHFETFTIRYSRPNGSTTEFEKRMKSYAENNGRGFIKPELIVQGYVQEPRREGKLLYACMCRGSDLYSLLDDHRCGDTWYKQVNPVDGVVFAVCRVDVLRENGILVRDTNSLKTVRRGIRPIGHGSATPTFREWRT